MENSTNESVVRTYDHIMGPKGGRLWDKIGFLNFGYWKGIEDSVEIAQINLIETLADFLSKDGSNVLDVACGKGASTKFLTKYFDPSMTTGINISDKQIDICRVVAPECTFRKMDAANLEFPDSTFDNILCIEAAQHFLTRHKFLEEAYRVLKPLGRIAMSDLVLHNDQISEAMADTIPKEIWPKENELPNLEIYRENLLKIGFRHVHVEDSTELSVVPFFRFLIRKSEKEFNKNPDFQALKYLMHERWSKSWTWCMVYAIK